MCVWQAVSWWATDLSGANSATVWVAMCQREVLLCCVGAVCVCVCVEENVLGCLFLFLETHIPTMLVRTLINIVHSLTPRTFFLIQLRVFIVFLVVSVSNNNPALIQVNCWNAETLQQQWGCSSVQFNPVIFYET